MQAGRCVQNHVAHALGRLDRVAALHVPPLNRRQTGRPDGEPAARRLLPIHIAKHHAMAAARQIAGGIAGHRTLANATFGIGNQDHRHASLLL